MDAIRAIIAEKAGEFPNLDYYLEIVEEAERHRSSQPDRCIETCKTLIEGVCRTILKTLDNAFDDKHVDGMKLEPLVARTFEDISKYDVSSESQFASLFAKLIQELNRIRNARGDISHGRASPKSEVSSPEFSDFVFSLTESTIIYLLRVFTSISPRTYRAVRYADYPDFNECLDSEFSELLGDKAEFFSLSYSQALFDQDFVDYDERLSEYLAELEELENEELAQT